MLHVVVVLCFAIYELAHFAAEEFLTAEDRCRAIVAGFAHGVGQTGLPDKCDDLLNLSDGHGHWNSTVDVLSSLERGNSHLAMLVSLGENRDTIELLTLEHLFKVVIDLVYMKQFIIFLAALREFISNAYELHCRMRLKKRYKKSAKLPAPNKANSDSFFFHR